MPAPLAFGRRRWVWPLGVLGAATAVAFASAIQAYAWRLSRGQPMPLWELLASRLPDWYIWAALSPIVLWLGRRFSLERPHRLRNVGIHLVSALGFALLSYLLACLYDVAAFGLPARFDSFWDYYLGVISWRTWFGLLVYSIILAAGQAHLYYRKYRESEVRASDLQAQLATAQLQALRMQLQPHFLFNTLHSIGVLVRTGGNDRALTMLTRLGDLLRHSLESIEQEVTLEEELRFVRRYLDIEQLRFGDRLRLRFELDPAAGPALVPNLLIQPLVENAVRHGVAPYAIPSTVEIAAWPREGRLFLEVRDDGLDVPNGWRPDEGRGVGLRNVRERLERMYPGDHRFQVRRQETGGVVAAIDIPLRRRPAVPVRPAAAGATYSRAAAHVKPHTGAEVIVVLPPVIP